MHFECTETEIRTVINGERVEMFHGNRLTVPDAWGVMAVEAGWGIDLDGNVETGERNVDKRRVVPANVIQVMNQASGDVQ